MKVANRQQRFIFRTLQKLWRIEADFTAMLVQREVKLNSKLDAHVLARRFQVYYYQYCIMVISIPVKCLYPVNSDIDRGREKAHLQLTVR